MNVENLLKMSISKLESRYNDYNECRKNSIEVCNKIRELREQGLHDSSPSLEYLIDEYYRLAEKRLGLYDRLLFVYHELTSLGIIEDKAGTFTVVEYLIKNKNNLDYTNLPIVVTEQLNECVIIS